MAPRPQRQRRKINWSAITSFITALTAVGALIFTGLSLNAARDQVAVAQGDQRVAQQGQFTDRYSRAIEQLGRPEIDQLQIRLGGIYALERLAIDSRNFQPTVIEVLSTFVRTKSAKSAGVTTGPCAPEKPPADIEAAVIVLGRRNISNDDGAIINLAHACLAGVNLWGAKFTGANLAGVDLSGADLSEADLDSAKLTAAILTSANVGGTNFDAAQLEHADLSCISRHYTEQLPPKFRGANLSFASLEGAKINGFISGNHTYGADFRGAILDGANLNDAGLRAANFDHVDLSRTTHLNTIF
jgi:uncharacterized protein YjbI with pentapeptide repeats